MSNLIHTTLALLTLSLSLSLGTAACTAGDDMAEDDLEEEDIGSDSEAVVTVPTSTQWVTAHNNVRKPWHEAHGGTYQKVSWNSTLATKAKTEAQYWLHQYCDLGVSPGHRSGNVYGENGLGNKGTGSWGLPKTADVAVGTRWVAKEEGKSPPNNDHLTQVMWHSTKYVGCYTAYKQLADGQQCSVQYCEYSKAGNCNFNAYSSWEDAVMQETGCGGAL